VLRHLKRSGRRGVVRALVWVAGERFLEVGFLHLQTAFETNKEA
jgi:hypothetical protein